MHAWFFLPLSNASLLHNFAKNVQIAMGTLCHFCARVFSCLKSPVFLHVQYLRMREMQTMPQWCRSRQSVTARHTIWYWVGKYLLMVFPIWTTLARQLTSTRATSMIQYYLMDRSSNISPKCQIIWCWNLSCKFIDEMFLDELISEPVVL